MSGSKTTSDDEQHHFSSSSGSGHYHHHATTSSPTKRQQNLLQETTAAVPFSSPAISPIPKHNDENDLHDLVAYPSEIAGSSNDDSEPYLLSSMSEEDHLKLGGTAGGSTIAVPQDNATNTTTVEKSTPLHMEFELKPSTSSEENKIRSNNSREAHQQQQQPQQNVVPVNFKKKELRCVTDVQLLTSVGMSGSFSPMGNNSVATNGSMDTPTGNRFQLPKFYDSEEEGVGSLVLVPSSKSLSSPRMMVGGQGGPSPTSSSFANAAGGGGGPAPPPQFPLPKDHRHGLTTTPAHLLPYQQRKKLIVEQVPNTPTSTDKRPPVPPSSATTKPPPPSSSFGGAAAVGGNVMVVASEPPPIVSGAQLAKKYGGVAEIPPFKGAGDNITTNDVEGTTTMTPMKKSKSADSSNKPIPPPPTITTTTFSSPVNNNSKNDTTDEKREEKKTENDASTKQTPRPIPVLQEVICPSQPQSPSMRSSSPSGEGSYHIRVSSCGSISSLGSMAVDSDSIRHAPRRDHPNHNGGQHQQQQQQQQYYQQMQPPPPNHYYGGYPQPQPPMRGPPNGGGFVDLSQDIALYLHGEQIANGGGEAPHHGHGEYPPQNYWNQQQHDPSQYGYGGGGQQHPYQQQQQQHYPPPLPQAEPIPPPLTQVPNMQMGHRSRLPSISDDDWSEDIEKYKADMDGRDDGNRGGGGGRNGNNNNQQQPYPLPPQRSYNYGRDRMAYPHQLPPPAQNRQRDQRKRKENHPQQAHPENRPNERSSLLGPNNRNYDEYGGWNGNGGGGGNNNPNPTYYTTPPRRGNKKNPQETKSTKRKKSKRRRDRRSEKEKLRNLYSTDSSPEEDEKHRRSVRSSRRKKRHGGRKRRDDDVSDTMSETYSESFMSASLTDRLKSAETNVNFFQRMMIRTKLLICNLPLSAAAISFSIVLLGIVWLRRAEEILTSCKEVNFHSSQCNFPEFPGCYFCDTFDHWYQVATMFHTICSYVGGLSVALYAAKAMLFGRVFIDEMSSPTTASPAGLIFMTMALAFTGKGAAGAVAVFVASFLHLALLLWFIYMSLAYQTMPDPSWFPNTIGIGLCAVKVWFYNPLCGHFLIAMTLMLTFLYYPISLIRVALNEKMSSTICWMQMICPAISLYSLAIVMQPSFKEERPDISHFQTMQRSVYLPSMTCLFGLCIVGMISSLHGLAVRWKQIQKEEFTPAHAAYSFPLLMHALAVQAYRSSLGFFSETGEVNPALKSALEIYWIVLVSAGTFVAVVCLIMYLSFLPSWIDVNTSDELEPPAPNETSMFETVTWGESLIQPYVSPTILQSNETGVLVMTHDYENNWDSLVRTKNVPAVGFEPMMRTRTFNREREALKHLVGGQDIIHEGDEADDDFCFENVNV